VTTIESSPTWNDPTQRDVIIITSDEDYNNLSLGIGNEGNNVPMIVIPNQGAVNAGMQSGPFTTNTYYNQYSLMATIEDSLGLAPLTANDMYAQPMNDFWKSLICVTRDHKEGTGWARKANTGRCWSRRGSGRTWPQRGPRRSCRGTGLPSPTVLTFQTISIELMWA
jgi:hypothetical protein